MFKSYAFLFSILIVSLSTTTYAVPSSLNVRQSTTPSASGKTQNVSSFTLPAAIDFDVTKTPFPKTKQGDAVLAFQSATKGMVSVPDIFNWFENVNESSSDIEAFIETQLNFTNDYLTKVSDVESIKTSIKIASEYEIVSLPQSFGESNSSLYIYYIVAKSEYYRTYYIAKQDEIDKTISENFTNFYGIKYFNSSLLGDNYTSFGLQISPDGQKVLYSIVDLSSFGGNQTSFVRDLSSPLLTESSINDFTDSIPNTVSAGWGPDSKSIYYIASSGGSNDSDPLISSVGYHVLGTDVSKDIIIASSIEHPEDYYDLDISDDNKSLILYIVEWDNVTQTETSRQFIGSLDQTISSSMKWVIVPSDNLRDYFYLTNIGSDYYFTTQQNFSAGHIVHYSIDLTQAQTITNFHDSKTNEIKDEIVIPDNGNSTVVATIVFDTDKVLIRYKNFDLPSWGVYELKTGKQLQYQNELGPSFLYDAQADNFGKSIYLFVTPFNSPQQLSQLVWDSTTNQIVQNSIYYQTKDEFIIPDDYIVQHQLIESTDGVHVPTFMLYHKDTPLDGSSHVIFNVYGAYGVDANPIFNSDEFAIVHDYHSILVYAGIRGGNDVNGDSWHKAAINESKHHTFEDIFSVSNFLIENNFTSKGEITLTGEGAGALAGAVVINQDNQGLFRALIAKRGTLDMLRLDISTGDIRYRIEEFGDPKDPKAFDWLFDYSPVQNINKDKPYPLIVVQAGENRDFNEPFHSYKYLALLQTLLPSNPNPFFLGNSTADDDEQYAVASAIILHATGQKKVA